MFLMAKRLIIAVLALAVAIVVAPMIAGAWLGHPYIYDPLVP